MKLIAPDYYPRFSCLMGDCRHSCCRLWEIDIDEDTLEYYKMLPGDLGKRICSQLREEEDGASFILTEEGNCPFLQKDGLCEIIRTLGEAAVSDICDDHPRFRNFYSGITETGLGLSCEAAGKLIIGAEEPVSWIALEDDGEEEPLAPEEEDFRSFRDKLISLAQNRGRSVAERVNEIAAYGNVSMPDLSDLPAFCKELECMEAEWRTFLNVCCMEKAESFAEAFLQKPLEQVLVYIIFRNLPASLEDGLIAEHLKLCLSMFLLISGICAGIQNQKGSCSQDDLIEVCRAWSSEIEYSDENPQKLLQWSSGTEEIQ